MNHMENLRRICFDGIEPRYGFCPHSSENSFPEEQRKIIWRLDYELEVIERAKSTRLFLKVFDALSFLRERVIVVGTGRDSSSGSIVAYLGGLTCINPLQFSLLFERFINPERIIQPVFHLEIPGRHKDDLLDYFGTRYGETDNHDREFDRIEFVCSDKLAIIEETIRLVKKKSNLSVDMEKISLCDEETFNLFNRGNTDGLFQSESRLMRDICSACGVGSIKDIMVFLALCSPPLTEFIPEFISRKNAREIIRYDHPGMEDILEETCGVPLYQEQMMLIISKYSGLSLGRADLIRRSIGKINPNNEDVHGNSFLEACQDKGTSECDVNLIWNWLCRFACYSVNKSCCATLAMLAYRMAYLKANFPDEFIEASILNGNPLSV